MEKFRQKSKMIEYEDDKGHSSKENKTTHREAKIYEIPIDAIKAKKQCKLIIEGIEVYFPYPPYSNQLAYMEKGKLGALESPTGTGKTLCLLCASLGWLRAKRKEMKDAASRMHSEEAEEYVKNSPFIFYSSRTHSQLANVIKELKKTCYLPSTATLSSRDQMCVNTAVKQFSGNMLNIKCKQARVRRECKYFNGTERLSLNAYDCTDIEELYSIGQKSGFCPFYFQRNKKEIADVLFLPYNYIFESKFRKVLKLELKNAIVLIDEAHNMENVCEHSKSCELSLKMIDECLNDLKSIKILVENIERVPGREKDSILRSLEVKKIKEEEVILNNMKSYLKAFTVRQGNNWPNFGLKLTPKEFFDVFFEGSKRGDKTQTQINPEGLIPGLTPENIQSHVMLLKKIESGIVDELQKTSILSNYSDILELVSTLSQNYLAFTKSGDTNPTNCHVNNYKIFLNDIEDFQQSNLKGLKQINTGKIRTICMFCFNPGYGFKDVMESGAQTIIITSGTLTPMESMETELKCNFPIKLENKHVIDKCQVKFSILCNSFKAKTNFRFDAGNRNNNSMIEELGNTISDLCKVTPGGILVFFTAYNFLNTCIGVWAEKEIISEIEKSKEIFRDVSDSAKNKGVLKNFTECCQASSENAPSHRKQKKGGILFSVCRGSSSEGIDFSDDMARMVIVVGIPYPNLGDVKVNLKREFIDEFNTKYFSHIDKSVNIKKLTSSDWYTQSATKAVNQALGRVIRHIDDYGSMILIDSRYKELHYKRVFSAWLRDSAKIYEDNKLLVDSRTFYDDMKSYIPEKRQKRKEAPIVSSENKDLNSNIANTNSNSFTTNNKVDVCKFQNNVAFNRDINISSITNNQIAGKSINSINNTNARVSSLEINSLSLKRNGDEGLINYSETGMDFKRSKKDENLNLINISGNNITNSNVNSYNNISNQQNSLHFPNRNNILTNNLSNNISYNNMSNNILPGSNNINSSNIQSNNNQYNNIHSNNIQYNNIQSSNPFNPSPLNANSNVHSSSINSVRKIIQQNNTTSIIDDIKSKIDCMNRMTHDIKQDMNKINIESEKANLNKIQLDRSSAKKKGVTYTELTDIRYAKRNEVAEEDTIFDSLNQDELMDIINQNISIFEEEEVNDNTAQNKKTPKMSTSKKKVYRQTPSGNKVSNIESILSNAVGVLAPNNLSHQFMTTPAKSTSDNEIKSEIIVKKLLELKERSQLDFLLEKYNLKMCFDSQTVADENKPVKNEEKDKEKEKSSSKKIECPICFEFTDKKYQAAKCGHILCNDCWGRCLDNKLECPMCKKKVRPSTLVNIFL